VPLSSRVQDRAAGRADPAAQYVRALQKGDSRALETVWPGEVVVHDPHVGELRGHRELRRFVRGEPVHAGRAPQAGIVIYERGPHGLRAAGRVYDDVEAPLRNGPEPPGAAGRRSGTSSPMDLTTPGHRPEEES